MGAPEAGLYRRSRAVTTWRPWGSRPWRMSGRCRGLKGPCRSRTRRTRPMADGAVGDLADTVEKPGAVILARHGQPALSRRCVLSADQYREWWADYETGGLLEGQTP